MPKSKKPPQTILVVDDDEAILSFLSRLLSSKYTVLVAPSGEDALRQSREHKGTLHLLLSNVQMPGISGVELATQLNLERPEMQVMLMSGYASGMLVLNTGWHFLHKPFIPSQLLDLISSILNQPSLADAPDIDEQR